MMDGKHLQALDEALTLSAKTFGKTNQQLIHELLQEFLTTNKISEEGRKELEEIMGLTVIECLKEVGVMPR